MRAALAGVDVVGAEVGNGEGRGLGIGE